MSRGTPHHAIRINDRLWDLCGERARDAGTDRNSVLREFIRWYVGEPGAEMPRRPAPPGRQP